MPRTPADHQSDGLATLPKYPHPGEVPDGLLTEGGWKSLYRRLKKDAPPRAGLKDAECEFHHHRLYSIEDTLPLTKKQRAEEYLWRTLVASHNGDRHIVWVPDRNGWVTVTPSSRLLRFESSYLRRADLTAHLAHKEMFGVFGGRWTRWLAIDLDLHDTESTPVTTERQAVFLDMLAVALAAFHADGWHVQVKDRQAGGSTCSRYSTSRPCSTPRCYSSGTACVSSTLGTRPSPHGPSPRA